MVGLLGVENVVDTCGKGRVIVLGELKLVGLLSIMSR